MKYVEIEIYRIGRNIWVNESLHHDLGYEEYKIFDVNKFDVILVLPMFRLIRQSFSRFRCWMKSLHSASKLQTIETQQNHKLKD